MKLTKTFALALSLCLFLLATALYAADNSKDGITGKITVSKDEKGKVESITLAGDDGKTYTIPASGKGAKLAKDAEDETVEIKGKVSEKKDKEGAETLVLNVNSYVLVFTGKVAAELNDNKKLTGVTIGGRALKLDGKAKEIAEKADGKEVTATGEVMIKKGKDKEEEKFLVIKDYEIKE